MPPFAYTRWPVVEGYASRRSYRPGETVSMRCSSRVGRFNARIERVGRDRTLIWERDGIPGFDHPVPNRAWATGCDWPVTFRVPVADDWRPGFYLVTLEAPDVDGPTATSEAFFVVGSHPGPDRPAIVLVVATNTYNAYNQWGGGCLYTGADRVSVSRPTERGFLSRPAAPAEVAFDGRIASAGPEPDAEHVELQRYQTEHQYPLWSASAGWHNWERRFVAWAEGEGIELDYAIDPELQFRPDLLQGRRLGLTVGHSEYWSWEMRDAIDAFVDQGGNWAIFGGNTCYWQVRYEDEGHVMVCHKGQAEADDPAYREPTNLVDESAAIEPTTEPAGGGRGDRTVGRRHTTTIWSNPYLGRPETTTTGLTFTRGGYARIGQATPASSGGYTVARPDHWALAGTGLCYGDTVGGPARIVGYEVDGCALTLRHGRPVPTHEDGAPADLDVIATAPAHLISITPDHSEAPAALWAGGGPPGDLEQVAAILHGDASPANVDRVSAGHAVMASFTRGPGSGTVFNAGTTDWAYGLDADPLVGRITANVIHRLSGR